jgi:hypothetical protein
LLLKRHSGLEALIGHVRGQSVNRRKETAFVKPPAIPHLEADLRRYLQGKKTLFDPEIHKLVSEINKFTRAILRDGFEKAVAQLRLGVKLASDRPFIEVCDAIIDHHTRALKKTETELVGKSLFEAYIYAAGSEHAFESASKTQIVRSLRRRGAKGFASLFLSLHLFNVISLQIQDDVHARIADLKSFEIYMLGIEAVCRDTVTAAMKIPDGELDETWAASVCDNIDAQLLQT